MMYLMYHNQFVVTVKKIHDKNEFIVTINDSNGNIIANHRHREKAEGIKWAKCVVDDLLVKMRQSQEKERIRLSMSNSLFVSTSCSKSGMGKNDVPRNLHPSIFSPQPPTSLVIDG